MSLNKKNYIITVNGVPRRVTLDNIHRNTVEFTVEDHSFSVSIDPELAAVANTTSTSAPIHNSAPAKPSSRVDCTDGVFRAPMPGILVKLEVEVGQSIQPGQQVAVIEAMKMENAISCPVGGKISAVLAKSASEVKKGQELFKFS